MLICLIQTRNLKPSVSVTDWKLTFQELGGKIVFLGIQRMSTAGWWWHTPLITALGRQRQASSRTARATQRNPHTQRKRMSTVPQFGFLFWNLAEQLCSSVAEAPYRWAGQKLVFFAFFFFFLFLKAGAGVGLRWFWDDNIILGHFFLVWGKIYLVRNSHIWSQKPEFLQTPSFLRHLWKDV